MQPACNLNNLKPILLSIDENFRMKRRGDSDEEDGTAMDDGCAPSATNCGIDAASAKRLLTSTGTAYPAGCAHASEVEPEVEKRQPLRWTLMSSSDFVHMGRVLVACIDLDTLSCLSLQLADAKQLSALNLLRAGAKAESTALVLPQLPNSNIPIMPQWMEPTEPAREVFARLLISLKHELVYGGSNGVYSGVGVISASGGSHLSGSGNQQNVASSATVHDLKDILSKLLKAWNDTPYSVLRLNSAAAAFMHSRPRAGSPNVVTPLPAGSPVGGISSSASSTPGSAGPSGTGGVNWGQLSSLLKSRVGFGASATIAHDDNGTRVRGGSGADSYGVVDDSEMDGDGAGIGLAFSNSSSAVSLDRLHAAAISASSAAASPQQNSGPSPPPAQAWTPFQTLISRLHGFDYTVSVNALQGKPISTPVRETLAVMAAQAGQVISPQPSPTTPTLSLVGHGLWHGSAHTQTQYQPAVSVGGHAVSAWAAIGASPLSSAQQQPQEQAKGSGNAFRGFPSGTPASTNTVTSVTSGGYGFVPTPSSSSSLAPAAASSSSSDSASSAAAAAAAAASLVPRPGPMYGNGFVSYSMGMASPTAASAAAAASRSPQHMSAAAGFNSASGSFSGWGQPAATQAQAAGGGLSSNGFAHEGSSSGSNGSWTSSGLQNAHAAASMHPSYLHAGVHAHSSSSAVSSGFSRYGDGMDDL